MNSHYEELYGVGLLDDLHNYFPALLYDPDGFPTVRSVLQYVQQQTRNRFDLFSLGQREYRGRISPSSHLPPPPPPTTIPSVRLTSSDISGTAANRNSTFPASLRVPLPPRTTNLHYVFDLNEPEEEASSQLLTTQLLTSLLRLNPLRPLSTGGASLDAFLQPVVVRATEEQIQANTTVGNLVSDEDHACAICQDTLQPEQEGRKLNACGHWFHRSCIDTWLEGNVHCPVCRHDIREPIHEDSEQKSAEE